MLHVELVDRVEFELDLLPRLHGDLQFGAVFGGLGQDVLAFLLKLPALVAGLHAGLERDAVGRGACGVAPGMAQCAAAELQDGVVAEDRHQRRHVPDVDAARGDREDARHPAPVLVEEDAAVAVLLNVAQREAYLELGGTPFLDGEYTVFGQVVEGLEVIDSITAQETDPRDRPTRDIKMKIRVIQ